ncbi:TolC family protein [Caballeronia sp. TF1N1]|uniref:TolC family protein n=1 Tax=Caballeronia sp. TF1N1 TaxID=2878153 RepID=UPI001FD4D885|nr:TolC family protein [Caballeronia sp. TF1N1]
MSMPLMGRGVSSYVSFAFAIAISQIAAPAHSAVVDTVLPENVPIETEIRAFGECDAAVPSPMTLTALSSAALCRNPDAKAALAQVMRSEAFERQSRAPYYPQLEGSGYVGKLRKDTDYTDIGVSQRTRANTNNLQANLTWLLYDFGSRSSNLSAGKFSVEAAIDSRSAAIQEILHETAKRFYDLESKEGTLTAYEVTEKLAIASFAVAQAQNAAGVGQLSNKLLLESNVARARANTIQARGAVDAARASLLSFVGFAPSDPLQIEFPSRDSVELTDPSQFRSVVTDALAANPRIKAARAQLSAAESNVAYATAGGLPTISLALSSGRSNALPSDQVAQRTTALSAVVQVRIPFFDGFSQRAKAEAARADMYSRQVELEKVERDVSLDAWQSYLGWQNGVQRLNAAKDLLAVARASVDIAQGRLKAGVGDALEVLKAQEDFSNANFETLDAVKQIELSRSTLAQALGALKP